MYKCTQLETLESTLEQNLIHQQQNSAIYNGPCIMSHLQWVPFKTWINCGVFQFNNACVQPLRTAQSRAAEFVQEPVWTARSAECSHPKHMDILWKKYLSGLNSQQKIFTIYRYILEINTSSPINLKCR